VPEADVAKKARRNHKKLRTREHVLADLGVNFVERQVLLHGWSVDRFEHDYGIDLFMVTYSQAGEIENGRVLFQVKATDSLRRSKDGSTFAIPLSSRDLRYWLGEPAPVILIVYDAKADQAYWVYVQQYFEQQRAIDLATAPGRVTVHVSMSKRLDQDSLDQFGRFRDEVLRRLEGKIQNG
jgi:hypothetical protein